MDNLEHVSTQAMLFLMLYGGAAVTAAILCLYLLLRKGNAIAPDITPPVRLRRWAAALFGVAFVGHCYWFFFYSSFLDKHSWRYVLPTILDCVTLTITFAGTLLSMLQDRRRPIWPFTAATIPTVILGGMQIYWPSVDFIFPIIVYTLSVYGLFTAYMAMAVKEYQRWLRDNYADLEHKEVWTSHTLIIVILLLFVNYGFANDNPSSFFVRLTDFLLFGMLLWRVETLPQLEEVTEHEEDCLPELEEDCLPELEEDCLPEQTKGTDAGNQGEVSKEEVVTPLSPRREIGREVLSNTGQLLEKHCEDTWLYLQHDLSLTQLSAAVGINRYYLGQYFASQDMNYNTYINGLRIKHFVNLCREAIAARRPFTAQQLASESGYRSYSTFSAAFKQRMGQSVTSWIREVGG